jgi:aryl-alcohol dehydrogenase-like predicted oxidoreductase
MLPNLTFGRTGLQVTRIGLGGFPFGGINKARNWDPFTAEGQATAISTIHAALDAGITYMDTAPGYGKGNSESIFGHALKGRRNQVALASKAPYRDASKTDVIQSVEASLKRLQTDVIDVIQFHGGMCTDGQVSHILTGGPLDAFLALKEQGKVRFLGFTVEEPWTAKSLIATGHFDVMQVRYNIIYQVAALHVLNEAHAANMGIAVMRPMTSGIFQRLAEYLAPNWQDAHDLYEVALKYVLSDSRVHVANVGMRWPEEVQKNVSLASSFTPPFDMSELPRMTAHIYNAEDDSIK